MNPLNESLLISDQDETKLEQFEKVQSFTQIQHLDKSIVLNQSINFSSVNHREAEDSVYYSFMSRINTGLSTQQQALDIKSKYIKLKSKYDKLYKEHIQLKNKFEKHQTARVNRMISSTKHNNSRVQAESAKRRLVSLNKNSKFIESVHHPVSVVAFEKRDENEDMQPLLKDTKTLLLFEEVTKLHDFFEVIKTDLLNVQEWINDVIDERGTIISILSDVVGQCLQKINGIQNGFEELEIKVSQLIFECKRTDDAFEIYKKRSQNLIQYYRIKYQQISRRIPKANSSKSKSAGRVSNINTTTQFKFARPRCFIDQAELQSVKDLQRVINEQAEGVQLIQGVNQTQCIYYLKNKVEEYVRSIHSIKQLVNGGDQQLFYLQNISSREWMSDIIIGISKLSKCKEFLKQMHQSQCDYSLLDSCFRDNVSQIKNQISLNQHKYISKIKNLNQTYDNSINLFILSVYSTFAKTFLTNLINANQIGYFSSSFVKWRKIAVSEMGSLNKTLQQVTSKVQHSHNARHQIIKQQEKFILKVFDCIEQLNNVVMEIEKILN